MEYEGIELRVLSEVRWELGLRNYFGQIVLIEVVEPKRFEDRTYHLVLIEGPRSSVDESWYEVGTEWRPIGSLIRLEPRKRIDLEATRRLRLNDFIEIQND